MYKYLVLFAFVTACGTGYNLQPGNDGGDATPVCGNGQIEAGEQCDGTDFGGATCQSLGFVGGDLACTAGTCEVYRTGCHNSETCGNGVIDTDEVCDGTNLDQQDCTALGLGFTGGTLTCAGNCLAFNTSLCTTTAVVCGDGVAEGQEDCDGQDFRGATCFDLGFVGGELACTATCNLVQSACLTTICGDGFVGEAEECDGQDFGGQTCQDFGFAGGDLACTQTCTVVTGACWEEPPVCGDGVIEGNEQCDDNNAQGGDGCSPTCHVEAGWYCTGEPSTCTTQCGDGVRAGTEACDGGDLCTPDCRVISCGGAPDFDMTNLVTYCDFGSGWISETIQVTNEMSSLLYRYGGGGCTSGVENTGSEVLRRIVIPANRTVQVRMMESYNTPNANLNLFVLREVNGDCNPAVECIGEDQSVCPAGQHCYSTVNLPTEPVDTAYYVVVEQFSGPDVYFALQIGCI